MEQYYFVTTSTEGDNKDEFFVIAESAEDARNRVSLKPGEKIDSVVFFAGLSIEHKRWRGELENGSEFQ